MNLEVCTSHSLYEIVTSFLSMSVELIHVSYPFGCGLGLLCKVKIKGINEEGQEHSKHFDGLTHKLDPQKKAITKWAWT